MGSLRPLDSLNVKCLTSGLKLEKIGGFKTNQNHIHGLLIFDIQILSC